MKKEEAGAGLIGSIVEKGRRVLQRTRTTCSIEHGKANIDIEAADRIGNDDFIY